MMKNTLIILFACSLSTLAFGQIPNQWYGHYAGDLEVTNFKGERVNYHMEFELSPVDDSTYNWIIIYGEDSLRQERCYLLRNCGENKYVIDEQNGIVLSCNKFENSFISLFEVQGNLIQAIYTFNKGKLDFRLTSSTNKKETGNVTYEEAEIPLVYGYETVTDQKATLKKLKRYKSK